MKFTTTLFTGILQFTQFTEMLKHYYDLAHHYLQDISLSLSIPIFVSASLSDSRYVPPSYNFYLPSSLPIPLRLFNSSIHVSPSLAEHFFSTSPILINCTVCSSTKKIACACRVIQGTQHLLRMILCSQVPPTLRSTILLHAFDEI